MMNILLAGDKTVLSGMEIVIYSTMRYNKNIHWHIFTMDVDIDDMNIGYHRSYTGLDENDIKWLQHIVNSMDENSTLTVYDVKDKYLKLLDSSVNRLTPFTPYAGLRLLAELVLPVDQCWYFDADILVQDNIEDMYNSYKNININYAACIASNDETNFSEMISGVLIMKLQMARDNNWLNKARVLYNILASDFPDQLALEMTCPPYRLDDTYDYIKNHSTAPYRPKILHFTNENTCKIYMKGITEDIFYGHYPEHIWVREGLTELRSTFNS